MERHHTIWKGTLGTIAGLYGALAPDLTQLEHWLRIVSLGLGIATAAVMLYSLLRGALRAKVKERREQVELEREEFRRERELVELCEACMRGHPPRHCPLPVSQRPEKCPKEKQPTRERNRTYER